MRKYLYIILGLTLAIAGSVWAIPITVPSSPSAGYMLTSTSTGQYLATTTDPLHVGSIYSTSTATSTFSGGIRVNNGGITVIGLSSCNLDTDANGGIICGTDANSGGTNDWVNLTTYSANALTPSTTVPVWLRGAVYASSTLLVSATSTFNTSATIATQLQIGTTTSQLPNNRMHIVAGDESTGLTEKHLAPKVGSSINDDYILVGESGNAVIALVSDSSGGHGSGIEFTDMDNATMTNKWWLGRETSGQGAGSTGNSDFALYYSANPDYLGTSTAISRFLTVTTQGRLGVGYTLPEALLHTLVEDAENNTAFKATQQDVTNNPRAAYIVNAGTGVGLDLDQDGNGIGASINTDATTVSGLRVQNNTAVRSGTGAASLFYLLNDEPTGTGDVFTLRQDAGSKALLIDDNGAGLSFEVDKDVTNTSHTGATGHSFRINNTNVVSDAGTYTKSGSIFSVTSAVTETSGTITDSAILIDLNQSHADASGNIIDINTAGTGAGILVDGTGSGFSGIFNNGNVGIGTTTPGKPLTVEGTASIAQAEIGVITATSSLNVAGRPVDGYQYPAFSYATTTWSGTTTIPLGPAFVAETWSQVKCFTDVGNLAIQFNDGSNNMDSFQASTTVGTVGLVTNNTFTASEKRYVNVGSPITAPTKISCTVRKNGT